MYDSCSTYVVMCLCYSLQYCTVLSARCRSGPRLCPTHLLEGPLSQQVPLDARERLVRVVVSLLDEPQLLSLALVESTLHTTHKARVGEGRGEGREERRGEERR